MAADIHGHAILEHLIEAGGVLSLSALRAFAQATHGSDATYHTCSASQMSFDQLLEFLATRNKVTILGEQVTVHAENLCRHSDGEEHHSHS
jgi:probable metal-binding protein